MWLWCNGCSLMQNVPQVGAFHGLCPSCKMPVSRGVDVGKYEEFEKVAVDSDFSEGVRSLLKSVNLAVPELEEQARAPMLRIKAMPGYGSLAGVLDDALQQAQGGKGLERHAGKGEAFEDQQIVQLGEWMGSSTVFAIGQACKKSIESTRLPDDRARAELLGAINYLAAAVLVIDRRTGGK